MEEADSRMQCTAKERNALFDNLKFLLICLVVFGHVNESFGNKGILMPIRAMIYSFHMPLFIFISGYFSKNLEKTYCNAVKSCFIPYLLFNTLWVWYVQGIGKVNVLHPFYVFWFLLSLFFWRIFLPAAVRVKGILWISVLLALYIGIFPTADRFLSISRTIVFFPYFLLGYFCNKDVINKIRRMPKWVAWGVTFFSFLFVVIANITKVIPVKSYENLQCYQASDMSNLQGILIRMISYIVAVLLSVCFICLISDKEKWYTKYGEQTVVIYLLSSFVMSFLLVVVKKYLLSNYKNMDSICLLGVSVIVSVIVIAVCAAKPMIDGYKKVMDIITNFFDCKKI